MSFDVTGFREAVATELTEHILPWWITHAPDEATGRWQAELNRENQPVEGATEGLILNTRLLWSFAAVYRSIPNPIYLEMAQRAKRALDTVFTDPEHGGGFWAVNRDGSPADIQKLLYGQAFWAYGLAELAMATGSEEPYSQAMRLWRLVDSKAHDEINLGYFESFDREWRLKADGRLSEVDMTEPKSMNAHLHVLEALTNLYRVDQDSFIGERLDETILMFERHIIRPDGRSVGRFFDQAWGPRDNHRSFGHEVETGWLLAEAAEVLEGSNARVADISVGLAQSVLDDGVDPDGGVLHQANPDGVFDSDKHWWPQAEAVIGFLNAYQISGDERFLDASWKSWTFIQDFIIDRQFGEWFWLVHRDGTPDLTQPKLAPWKACYHNGRMCLELIHRLRSME